MKLFSRAFLSFAIIYALCVVLTIITHQPSATAATDNTNVVISQVQTGSTAASDEFVELYNPTNTNIDLTGWSLKSKTASQSGSGTTLVASLSGTVSPYSYFLIVSPEYTGSVSRDFMYSSGSHIGATNNTVLIYDNTNTTPVDKVGMGSAADKETSDAPNPVAGGSIERKINDTGGNGLDTDNNANDFVLLSTSMPRNSASPAAQPIPTPTDEPTLTPEPTDTPIPTETPVPTEAPTLIPTEIPTQTPTITPTEVPTGTPVPTVTPSPTPTMTPTPTPPSHIIINEPITPRLHFVCTQTYRVISIFGFHVSIPSIHCGFVRG
ncbi:MAG TPA: lamin tail domain-containing protein [Candidatus Acidoferrales bacterium]|nr:lamin tail domain-containing protein [Candidatus Acidoferrales bacterium]